MLLYILFNVITFFLHNLLFLTEFLLLSLFLIPKVHIYFFLVFMCFSLFSPCYSVFCSLHSLYYISVALQFIIFTSFEVLSTKTLSLDNLFLTSFLLPFQQLILHSIFNLQTYWPFLIDSLFCLFPLLVDVNAIINFYLLVLPILQYLILPLPHSLSLSGVGRLITAHPLPVATSQLNVHLTHSTLIFLPPFHPSNSPDQRHH